MTTNPTITPSETQNWKWVSGILAAVVAMMTMAIAVESYFFYRTVDHPQASVSALTPKPTDSPRPAFRTVDDADIPGAIMPGASPWDQMNRLHQQMDQLFNQTLSQVPADDAAILSALSSPSLDVREEKDHYTVRVDMPGADKNSIKVDVEGRLLTVSGERTSVNETKGNDKVVRSERSMAQFVRTLELPGPVNTAAVDAKYENGVLTLSLPKASQATSSTQVPVH